jgi:hypothetical protein
MARRSGRARVVRGRAVLDGCQALEVGDVVVLVIELPDKVQVQLMTMVLRKGDERDYLMANFVDPKTLRLLRSLA